MGGMQTWVEAMTSQIRAIYIQHYFVSIVIFSSLHYVTRPTKNALPVDADPPIGKQN
jgi:hypothetical protein